MSSEPSPAVARKSPRRLWIPSVILLGAAAAATFIWVRPEEDMEFFLRVVSSYGIAGAAVILLMGWTVLLSGFSRRIRFGAAAVAALVGAAVAGSIRKVEMYGDIIPMIEFRWQVATHGGLLDSSSLQGETVTLSPISDDDYPEYRNRRRDGIAAGPAITKDWKRFPPQPLWKREVGEGYAAFSVVGDFMVTIEQRGSKEVVVCYEASTGKERWRRSWSALFTEAMGGPGPRATPTVADGEVYALGATGIFARLSAADGAPKWEVDILKENKAENLPWGMSGSPLVYDDLVVVNPGAQGGNPASRSLLAYDRQNGKLRWAAGTATAGYSSPMLATIAGKRQVLILTATQIDAHDPTTGEILWSHPFTADQGITVAQPLVLPNDRVFLSAGYGAGCAMIQVAAKEGKLAATELWKNKNMRCRFTSPVYMKEHIYGLDDGILACVEAKTGRRTWKGGRYGHGQVVLVDDAILVLTETGELALVAAESRKFNELGKIPAIDGKTWNTFAVARGKAFVRNHKLMAAFDLRNPTATAQR